MFDTNQLVCTINQQRLSLDRMPCNYGGYRYWFVCPFCKQRCRIVYYHGSIWQCRKCANLVYESQQATRNWRNEYRKAVKIARKIDPDYKDVSPIEHLLTEFPLLYFPVKPKYMKQAHYDLFLAKYEDQIYIANKMSLASLKAGLPSR